MYQGCEVNLLLDQQSADGPKNISYKWYTSFFRSNTLWTIKNELWSVNTKKNNFLFIIIWCFIERLLYFQIIYSCYDCFNNAQWDRGKILKLITKHVKLVFFFALKVLFMNICFTIFFWKIKSDVELCKVLEFMCIPLAFLYLNS